MIVDFLIPAIVTIVNVTTPILLAATGELIVEKSGVLNLGVEGMMLLGAIAGPRLEPGFGDGDAQRLARAIQSRGLGQFSQLPRKRAEHRQRFLALFLEPIENRQRLGRPAGLEQAVAQRRLG